MKDIYRRFGHRILTKIYGPFLVRERNRIFKQQLKNGVKKIPIFIISFNRLSYVKQMVETLEKYGLSNIYIIDNCSTYPPLLEYYRLCNHNVFYMSENLGYMVFWKSDMFLKYRENFYIVTDPDLEIPESVPTDFLDKMFEVLYKKPGAKKVGFSLRIDDLPLNSETQNVYLWEKQFYRKYDSTLNCYKADIDTTFALYLPDKISQYHSFYEGYRLGYPYMVRHLPWYKTEKQISDEDLFYSKLKTNGWFDPVKGFMSDEERNSNQQEEERI